jgi:hypothetical protein
MPDELARIAVGLPVASLWPLTVPYLAKSKWRVGPAALLSALYILAPQIPRVSSFVLLLAATAVPLALRQEAREGMGGGATAEASETTWGKRAVEGGPILAFLLLGLVAAALVDLHQGWDALVGVVESDRVAIAVTGLTAAVFISGSVVARVLRPFTDDLGNRKAASARHGLADAGRYIGWFERAVLFAFVIGGAPEAAAVALAAKSFARFPTFQEHQEGFAEYFLIGSLASIVLAVGAAAATRAALGIRPF